MNILLISTFKVYSLIVLIFKGLGSASNGINTQYLHNICFSIYHKQPFLKSQALQYYYLRFSVHCGSLLMPACNYMLNNALFIEVNCFILWISMKKFLNLWLILFFLFKIFICEYANYLEIWLNQICYSDYILNDWGL